jgi:hypothetical protein
LTEFPGTVSQRGMGRPPLKQGLKVKQAAVWLHEELLARIKAAAGKQGFSEFMRVAAEAELKRRERTLPKAKQEPHPFQGKPSPHTKAPNIEG